MFVVHLLIQRALISIELVATRFFSAVPLNAAELLSSAEGSRGATSPVDLKKVESRLLSVGFRAKKRRCDCYCYRRHRQQFVTFSPNDLICTVGRRFARCSLYSLIFLSASSGHVSVSSDYHVTLQTGCFYFSF